MNSRLCLLAVALFCFVSTLGCAQKVLKGERHSLPSKDASAIFPVEPTIVEKSYFVSFPDAEKESIAVAFAPEEEDGSLRVLSENEFEGVLLGHNGGYIMTLSSYAPKTPSRETLEDWQKKLAGTQHLYSNFTTDQGKTWRWFSQSYSTRNVVLMQATFTYVTDDALVVAMLRGPFLEQFVQEFGKSLRID